MAQQQMTLSICSWTRFRLILTGWSDMILLCDNRRARYRNRDAENQMVTSRASRCGACRAVQRALSLCNWLIDSYVVIRFSLCGIRVLSCVA